MNKTVKIIFIFAVLLLMNNSTKAQTITWNRVYGGLQQEYGKCGIQTSDGGYIIVSLKQGIGGGTVLLKLDQYGNEEWIKIIDSLGIGMCIQQTINNEFIIAGIYNGSKAMLIKTTKSGNVIWKKYYSINNEFSMFLKVKELSNGNLLMCGTSSIPPKAYFVKTDSLGNLIWQNSFTNSTSSTNAFDINESEDNYYYTTGVTSINGHSKTLIGKISSEGKYIWFKSHGSEEKGDSENGQIIIPETNNLISVGGTLQDFYDYKGHFSKYDSSGNFIYNRLYESMDEFHSMAKCISGYTFCGSSAHERKINFIKITKDGIEINNVILNSSTESFDYGNCINITLGGFIITGDTGPEDNKDVLVIKTDSGGYAPVKIYSDNIIVPSNIKLYQNYPNPFNPVTNLEFRIPESGFISMKVYDILGKEVAVLVNEMLSPGIYKATFNGSNFASGVYFVRMESGDFRDIKRMVLIK